MAEFKKYSKYKNSEYNYIGEIPNNWDVIKLRQVFKERSKKNKPIISKERLSLSIDKGVTLYSEKTTNLDRYKDDFTQYKLAYPNDLVLNSMNMIVGAAGISKYFGCVSPAYYVLTSRDKNLYNPKYFAYFFKTRKLQSKLFSLGKGIMAIERGNGRINTCRLKVPRQDLNNLYFPLPMIEEQNKIVDFITYKEKQINNIINHEKKIIRLLEEKKKIIITDAVTKGLDKNSQMKESAIDYIGQIPIGWSVQKLKSLTSIISKGTTPTTIGREIISNGRIRFLKGENIINNELCKEPVHCIDEKTNKMLSRSILKENDILFVIAGSIGKVAIVNKQFLPANTNQAISFIRLREKSFCKYIFYYLQSNCIEICLQNLIVKSAQPNLSMGNLKNFVCPIPPKEEMENIVNYLEYMVNKYNKIIKSKLLIINKLEEYRKILISNAVTGQIDIRDYEIKNIVEENIIEDDLEEQLEDEELNEVEYANN